MRKLRYCCSATYVAAHPELTGWFYLFTILKYILLIAGLVIISLVIAYLMIVSRF